MGISNDQGTSGVIKVGDGRGFIVEGSGLCRYVITAAHCLPELPPAHAGSDTEERTYSGLLGPIGGEPTVWAECLFVDPVADIAVLGSPDNQELSDEAEAYRELTDEAVALSISDLPDWRPEAGRAPDAIPAWLLSLENHWFRCQVKAFPRGLLVEKADEDIRGGMSGSPIKANDGSAIGILCSSFELSGESHRSGGPNPFLTRTLPGWLLRDINGA